MKNMTILINTLPTHEKNIKCKKKHQDDSFAYHRLNLQKISQSFRK